MKLLLVLAVVFVTAFAAPQDKNFHSFECIICHWMGPSLERFADEEGEIGEDFLKKECDLIPFLASKCDKWLKDHVDNILELLRADECMSACFACDALLKCGASDCQPSCGRPSCNGCSAGR